MRTPAWNVSWNEPYGWRAEYTPGNYAVLESGLTGEADTPEDALAKLAIELFKQGMLTT